MFTRWAGISPKRFLQFLTKESAKDLLEVPENLVDTHISGSGLSSLGPYTTVRHTEAVPRANQKPRRRRDHPLRESIHAIRQCLMGLTDRGILHLSFVQASEGNAIDALSDWKQGRRCRRPPRGPPSRRADL